MWCSGGGSGVEIWKGMSGDLLLVLQSCYVVVVDCGGGVGASSFDVISAFQLFFPTTNRL